MDIMSMLIQFWDKFAEIMTNILATMGLTSDYLAGVWEKIQAIISALQ